MWIPHPGPQEDFCSSGEFEILYGGAAGGGKTDCLIALATRWISNPRYHGLVLRRTFPRLQEVIDRCHGLYPLLGGVYKAGEHRWYFRSGAKITLGHMQHEDNKYDYQGKEFHFVGTDELTQFTETQYTYLFSRCRSTDPTLPTKFRSTANPGGIGHNWVKKRFIDICLPNQTYFDPDTGFSRKFIPAKLTDNPTLALNDPDYIKRLRLLPEIERMRLEEGIWDAFEGQVFTELSQRVHGIEPFDIPPEWYKFMTFDWGYSKPFSVGWYAVDYDGILYRYREWYGCKENEPDVGLKMSTNEIIQGIQEREKEKINARIADPAIWSHTPNKNKLGITGPSVNEDFNKAGVFFLKADNDRLQGKMQVHRRFEIERDVDPNTGEITSEHPRFYCFKNCKEFWRTIPELRESPSNPEDVDSDQEDHIYDEFRYGCMFRPVKPKHKEKIPQGSFQAERNRLIRAKKLAKAHGISLEAAYNRVR